MIFDVRAMQPGAGVVSLRLEAADADSALAAARARGLGPLSARPVARFGLPALRRGARFALLPFAQELIALLGAGLSLPEVLQALVEKETRGELRQVLVQLRDHLYEGRSFSQALQAQPAAFPPLFVASVKASEQTGDVVEALQRYVAYHERLDVVRKKLASAAVYPLVLLGVGLLVTLFLLGYVVPRFSAIYAESNRELPALSRLLLQWGRLMEAHGRLVALGAAAAVLALAASARRWLALLPRVLARVPALQRRLLVYHLARLYRTTGMLLRGGVPVVGALGMVEGLLPPAQRTALQAARRAVSEGMPLSQAMAGAQLTTPVATRLLRVGERSGDLAGMMDRIAAFHDEELSRWVDWFGKLFEPLLMAVIGLVIGGIVILMYLPIFELAGSLG